MPKLITGSTKTYTHSVGLSCCFRQWKASSHCNTLHGYALEVRIEFEGELDERNWVVDFGGLKTVKEWLAEMFDHTCLVAEDDPLIANFRVMHQLQMIDLRVVDNVGCEAFAKLIFDKVSTWVRSVAINDRVKVSRVEVREHQGNSAYVRVSDV